MITCNALSFRYAKNEDWVLRDVSVMFERGSVYHLRGKNGSGKTTFLQVLSQFCPRYTGGLLEGDLSLTVDPQKILFLQAPESMDFVYDRVDQELYFGFRIAGFDHEQSFEKIHEVLNLFQINGWPHRRIDSLSRGEKQFFRLVMMLTTKAYDLLCLDEPFAHMDRQYRDRIMHFLQEKMQTKTTTIVFADQHPSPWTSAFDVTAVDLAASPTEETPLWTEGLSIQDSIPDKNHIHLQQVGFAYPGQKLLFEPITINLKAASIVEIVGLNGSGKSTLLSMLLGDKQPTQGVIGHATASVSVCMLDDPLSQFVYPTMNQELKALGIPQRSVKKLHRSVVESHTAQQKVWMFQLVSQVAGNVVLLDEPFTYLDAENIQVMQSWMGALKQQGKTVIYTTVVSMEGLYEQQLALA